MRVQIALMTVGEFREKTTTPKAEHRGSELSKIDRMLHAWCERGKALTLVEKRRLLLSIITACKEWLNSKQKKLAKKSPSENTLARKAGVDLLARQAWDCYRYEIYEAKKSAAVAAEVPKGQAPGKRDLRPLQGVYQIERKLYEASDNLSKPISATTINGLLQERYPEQKYDDKTFSQLTTQDFKDLARQNRDFFGDEKEYVGFLSKGDRIRNTMVIIESGLFYREGLDKPMESSSYKSSDKQYSNSKDSMQIYSIDKYGNMYTMDPYDHAGIAALFGADARVNHSSMTAGAPVIAAGEIWIQRGKLRKITNTSGHYMTQPEHLKNALDLICGEGVNLGVVEAVILDKPNGQMLTFNALDFRNKGMSARVVAAISL